MAEYDLKQLYERGFGYVGNPLPERVGNYLAPVGAPRIDATPRSYIPGGSLLEKQEEQPLPVDVETSLTGVPIHMPLRVSYRTDEGEEVEFKFPNEPLIELRVTKNIIKTPIDSNDGTFKELFSMNDYSVTIKALLINEDAEDIPEEEITELRRILEHRGSLRINNRLTDLFRIEYIAINEARFADMKGEVQSQAVVIRADSDRLHDLELDNPAE